MNIYEQRLASAISCSATDYAGHFSVDIDVEGVNLTASGEYSIDGYTEDDYYNGTGAYIVRSASVNITDAHAYTEEGEEIEIPFSIYDVEEKAEDNLME